MNMHSLLEKFITESENKFTESRQLYSEQIKIVTDKLIHYGAEINLPVYISGHSNKISANDELQINVLLPSPIQIGWLESKLQPELKQIPALYDYIESAGLCIHVNREIQLVAHQCIQNIAIRIFRSLRPDLINPVIVDPEGNGSNFKLLCALDPAKRNLLFHSNAIKDGLEHILEEFRKLQTDTISYRYDSLEEANLYEKELAKPYTFVFISNFPAGHNAEGCKMIKNILQNSKKFGTFVFMTYNSEILPDSGSQEIVKEILTLIGSMRIGDNYFYLENCRESEVYNSNFNLYLDDSSEYAVPNSVEILNDHVIRIKSKPLTQTVYFEDVLASRIDVWSEYTEADSKNIGIKAPIGLITAKDQLYFTLDCETSNYHAIIGGKTGSGKTVLIDNLIINSSILYSPIDLQFVLLDFKGASFQKYKNLPHLKILFNGSKRSYGLNVLRFIRDENARRQEVLAELQKSKITDLTKEQRVKYNFPRLIVILDEFQILLKERDEIYRESNSIIDTIAQQGRSAGIHLILASQDLTGVTLSESAQANSNLRIALELEPIPCQMIFSRENLQATTLSKKGEAIYNDKSGRPAYGNIRFQGYYLEDSMVYAVVEHLSAKYIQSGLKPVDKFLLPNQNKAVFRHDLIIQELKDRTRKQPTVFDVFIGAPSFIRLKKGTQEKEESYIRFKVADNSNTIIAGNDMGTALSILGCLSFQVLEQADRLSTLYVYNGFGTDKIQVQQCLQSLSDHYQSFNLFNRQNITALFSDLFNEMQRRRSSENTPVEKIFTCLFGIDSSFYKTGSSYPEITQQLISLLRFGPQCGMHILLYTYSAKTFNSSIAGFNGVSTDLFDTKIILKGDGADIIGSGSTKLEPEMDGALLLYAPGPVTAMNPDLVNRYTLIEEPLTSKELNVLNAIIQISEIE